MQERIDLIELLLSLNEDELERTLNLFEKERTQQKSEASRLPHPKET